MHRIETNSPGPMPWLLSDRAPLRLSVMRGFEIRVGTAVLSVPSNVERVLAFLAVRQRPQLRSVVASTLWMDTTEDRAAANLRTALWRARQAIDEWLIMEGSYVALAPEVEVDLGVVLVQARRLIRDDCVLDSSDGDPGSLAGELLPDWDEDWIMFERERLRQLRIHALEALCRKLSEAGRPGEAIDAGLAAVGAEPLRESAQRVFIAAHLAEGNISEARRQYHLYRELLWEALGIEPSDVLRSMVGIGATSR